MIEVVFGAYDSDTDHAWHQLERGEISFVDALSHIKAAAETAGFRFDTGEMFSMMVTDEIDRELVVEAVRMVRAKGLRTALDRIGVADATRAIFLDDFPGNVDAARAMGMYGILVGEDPAPALDELLSLV
jgi:HAD superfamily hydrolase (TIGR01509 family)